jgi:hypothetical protein
MARKKKHVSFEEPVAAAEPEAFVDRTPVGSVGGNNPVATRITLPLTETGSIDWSAAKEGTSEQFTQAVLSDPATLEMIGLAAEQTEGPAAIPLSGWQPQQAGFALDMLGSLEALLFSKISDKFLQFHVDMEPAQEAFKLDENDHALIDAPAAKLMEKYIPVSDDWKDEVMFLSAYGYILTKQARRAVELQKDKNEREGVVIEAEPPQSKPNGKETVKH